MPPPQTPASRRPGDTTQHDRQRAQLSSSIRRPQAAAPPSSSQFAPTPRFNFASSARPAASQARPPSSASPLASRGRVKASQPEPEEDIDDEEGNESTNNEGIQQSIEDAEQDEMLLDAFEEAQQQQAPSELKRRHPSSSPPATAHDASSRKRIQAEPIIVSSSPASEPEQEPPFAGLVIGDSESDGEPELFLSPARPAVPEYPGSTTREQLQEPPPQTPARRSMAPKFRFTPAASTDPAKSMQPPSATPTMSHHPQFILPTQTELQSTTAMLPLLFSPQRRGQRYMPGGLAETVRDWVLEAGSQMILKQPQRLGLRELERIGPAGAMLAKVDGDGVSQEHTHIDFLLVADDGGTQPEVKVGDKVAARLGWELVLGRGEDEEAEGPTKRQTWQVAWGPV